MILVNSDDIVIFKNLKDKNQLKQLAKQLTPANHAFLTWVNYTTAELQRSYIMIDLRVETGDRFRIRAKILPLEKPQVVYIPSCPFIEISNLKSLIEMVTLRWTVKISCSERFCNFVVKLKIFSLQIQLKKMLIQMISCEYWEIFQNTYSCSFSNTCYNLHYQTCSTEDATTQRSMFFEISTRKLPPK